MKQVRDPSSSPYKELPERPFICIWLPQLDLESLLIESPNLKGNPVIMTDTSAVRATVLAASSPAKQAGVRTTMPLEMAQALCPQAILRPPDPDRVQSKRTCILQELYTLSPHISSYRDDVFFVDLSGLQRLHRDRKQVLKKIERFMEGFHPRPCVANGQSALQSWLSAHVIAHAPDDSFRLSDSALGHLPLPETMIQFCQTLGLNDLDDLRQLPSGSLIRRFGKAGARVEAWLQSMHCDQFSRYTPVVLERDQVHLEPPCDNAQTLLFICKRLLHRVMQCIKKNHRALVRFEITLWEQGSVRTRIRRVFHAHEPSVDERSLLELITLWLNRLVVTAPIESVELCAIETAHRPQEQLHLFEDELPKRNRLKLDALLSRLTASFGSESIASPVLRDTHHPEKRLQWMPITRSRKGSQLPADGSHSTNAQHAWGIVDPPIKIHYRRGIVTLPQRGCLNVLQGYGPYMFAGHWWEASDYSRKYELLKLETGELIWVFQSKRGTFLQAFVD